MKAPIDGLLVVQRKEAATLLFLISAAVTSSFAPLVDQPRARLLWNVSSSAPTGLYWMSKPAGLKQGDWVAAWLPASARRLAASRGYVPTSVPVLKRIAAAAGSEVCNRGLNLTIDRRLVAKLKETDLLGRPLPNWTGCLRLRSHQFMLINPAPASFDGRYFGATESSSIIGRATPIWLPK